MRKLTKTIGLLSIGVILAGCGNNEEVREDTTESTTTEQTTETTTTTNETTTVQTTEETTIETTTQEVVDARQQLINDATPKIGDVKESDLYTSKIIALGEHKDPVFVTRYANGLGDVFVRDVEVKVLELSNISEDMSDKVRLYGSSGVEFDPYDVNYMVEITYYLDNQAQEDTAGNSGPIQFNDRVQYTDNLGKSLEETIPYGVRKYTDRFIISVDSIINGGEGITLNFTETFGRDGAIVLDMENSPLYIPLTYQ